MRKARCWIWLEIDFPMSFLMGKTFGSAVWLLLGQFRPRALLLLLALATKRGR